MKKFVAKFLLLFVLIVCFIGMLNFWYVHTRYWKSQVVNQTIKFKDVPQYLEIANVGSNHGFNSFDYNDTCYQGFNFGINSQRFVQDYAVLKQYINQFQKNAVLLIPISYFQITMIKNDFTDIEACYYHFLRNDLIENYSLNKRILYTYLPVLIAGDSLQFIIRDIPSHPEYMTELELIEYSLMKYKDWTTNSTYEKEAGEEGIHYNKCMASKVIDFCYANDIQPVLVTTPITSVLNTIYEENSPLFFDTFYRFTRELQEDYPSLLYLDYSHDPRFENDFFLFQNGDHLNPTGAKIFTSIVVSDLQANGVLSLSID